MPGVTRQWSSQMTHDNNDDDDDDDVPVLVTYK